MGVSPTKPSKGFVGDTPINEDDRNYSVASLCSFRENEPTAAEAGP